MRNRAWQKIVKPIGAKCFFSPADCLDPVCSNHGVCIHGECHCNPGWGGNNCEILKTMCPDQCSGHGTYLQESGTCNCDPNWTGPDCSNGKNFGEIILC